MGLGVERLEVEGLGSTRLLTPLHDEEGGATGTGNHTSFLAAHWLPEMNGARSEPIADKLDFPGGGGGVDPVGRGLERINLFEENEKNSSCLFWDFKDMCWGGGGLF